MEKRNITVYDAAVSRIEYIFEQFDNVCVSFSGGKDSGVMLNLTAIIARRLSRKFHVMHLDYEAQYQATTDYVNKVWDEISDVSIIHHICIPFKAGCATSMFQNYWRPWESDKKEIWVREMPSYAVTENDLKWFDNSMSDYEFQERFGIELHKKCQANKTAILVGIRTDESFNRWRAIHKERESRLNNQEWTKQQALDVYNCYPIYDWSVEDIWVANGRFGWSYNSLYDLFYQAGLPLNSMRVASPFHSQATSSLELYRVVEPQTWGKLIGRVNGVNYSGIYGGTTAMGWKTITKPDHFTWKEYCYFLISTLPEEAKTNYTEKLETSIKFWQTKGGVMSDETIDELKQDGVELELSTHNYNTTKKSVKMKYLDDTSAKDFQHIPTYKRMCICIMKNDHLCKYMGFALTKKETEQRSKAISHYQNIL